MKKLIIIAIAIVSALAALWYFTRGNSELTFKTEKAAVGDIVETVVASGVVNPVNTILVGTQVSGTVSQIYVDFNSAVTKGQLIARIDPATFEARVGQARANLMRAEADLEVAQANLLNAKREVERRMSLLKEEVIPQSEYDKANTAFVSAKAQVSAAKAAVRQAGASLSQDDINLKYTSILSPVDGIVISRDVSVGQTVAASFQTPTLFTIAEDLASMKIEAKVDEADIGKIRAGQEATFTVDAYADMTFKGSVSQVRIAPTTIESVVTYDVIIMVGNPDLKLKPGMTATVSIITARKSGVLKVPSAAMRFIYPPGARARYKAQGIWVLKGKTPERVEVTTGVTDGESVEVVSGGLREGMDVIVESSESSGRGNNNGHRRGFL